jgi:hypothetical protein
MAGIQNFVKLEEDFLGPMTLTASPTNGDRWDIADTSSAGTPTYTVGGINGEATLAFDSQSEVQNVCLFQSDVLNWDIDLIQRIEMRVKTTATLDIATSLAFGLASARNDAIDSITAHASFRIIGNNTLVVESDDGTTDKDDVATGASLSDTYKKFVIDFTGGKSNVKFYVDGVRVAASTTFDMSGYTAGLQPYVQIQKTADTNTDSVTIDYIKIEGKRS